MKLLLEPIFEADFTDNAYGYRAGRSALDAVEDVDRGLRKRYVNVVDGLVPLVPLAGAHPYATQPVQRRAGTG